jgi:hypothetical protein
MLDLVESLRTVIDAPVGVVLACPVGVIAALHFAGLSNEKIQGSKADPVVKAARASVLKRPGWIQPLGISLGLGVAGGNFMYLQDPNFWPNLLNSLPF